MDNEQMSLESNFVVPVTLQV